MNFIAIIILLSQISYFKYCARNCDWGIFLGTVRLGEVLLTPESLTAVLEDMEGDGFQGQQYCVMERSCNTFTEVVLT